ncbi:MAG TPA: precorrin-8X methylmutase [Rhodospirillales bacterium]|nr:precorrin-8X methylmutase [Rhodospirillales bacterium]
MFDYVRDPEEIYRRSFEAINAAADLDSLPGDAAQVARRLVHASGMPDIIEDLRFSPGAGEKGGDALKAGASILVDAEMTAMGIIRRRLPSKNQVICTLNNPKVPDLAKALGATRSAAAVDLWRDRLEGAVVAIGNAPTALFRLLELLAEGAPRPALICGFPVGFIGAAESKRALVERAHAVPFIALMGRRGGSAMAAACVNALVEGP